MSTDQLHPNRFLHRVHPRDDGEDVPILRNQFDQLVKCDVESSDSFSIIVPSHELCVGLNQDASSGVL